jgi:hypothetical protein
MIATMVDYKDRLAEAMRDAGVDTAWLAKRLNVSYQAVKKVLDGNSAEFKVPNHFAAADLLGVSPRWLASGKAPKAPDAARQPGLEDLAGALFHALASLTPGRWDMVRARLDSLPGHPEMVGDVVADVVPILSARVGNRAAA